jgi:hypothetical protein
VTFRQVTTRGLKGGLIQSMCGVISRDAATFAPIPCHKRWYPFRAPSPFAQTSVQGKKNPSRVAYLAGVFICGRLLADFGHGLPSDGDHLSVILTLFDSRVGASEDSGVTMRDALAHLTRA